MTNKLAQVENSASEKLTGSKEKEDNIFKHPLLVPLMAIFACILWGSAFPALKTGYHRFGIAADDIFTKMLFAGYRFLLAAIFLFVFQLLTGSKNSLHLKRSQLKFILFLGLIQTTLQYFFFYNGLAHTTGVKGSILNTIGIFFTVIVSHFIYQNDKINYQKVIGLIIGLVGVVLVNLSKGSFNFEFKLTGEGFIIFSALASSIATIMVKNSREKIEIIALTAYQMLVGAIFLIVLALTKVSPFTLQFNPGSIMLLLYLAFISAAGFGLWYVLIKNNSLGYISIYRFMIPVSGTILSAIFLADERLSFNTFIALGLVSAAIIVINLGKQSN